MKFVALVSGGKDSIYAIQQAVEVGHELVACLHLARPVAKISSADDNDVAEEAEHHEESYMYQTAASEAVRIQVEECLRVPYFEYIRRGKSQQTGLIYVHNELQSNVSSHDEVEDLYHGLCQVQQAYPDIQAVCSGAILSTYQRVRVEHVACQRLQWHSLAYLWRQASQSKLLRDMLASGLDAILVRTAAPPGLLPHKHLGKSLSRLEPHLYSLYDKYQFHPCGEGGEYETFCVDSPMFHKRLVLDETRVELDEESDDTVGNLRILSCHAEAKSENDEAVKTLAKTMDGSLLLNTKPSMSKDGETDSLSSSALTPSRSAMYLLPRIKRVRGGLWHVSEISHPIHNTLQSTNSPRTEEELVLQEAKGVFNILRHVLHRQGCTPQDVVMVHLYLSQMSLFASINEEYQSFFGSLLPPSRSCVASAPGTTWRVRLDCLVQCGSGRAMRNVSSSSSLSTSPLRRKVLHVQSRSFWAPVCVGPYSQANTCWDSVHFLAGQIGLDPPTMTLVRNDNQSDKRHWKRQLQQTWTNVAQVLDALDQGSLTNDLLCCLVYIQQSVISEQPQSLPAFLTSVENLCCDGVRSNGGIEAGLVDKGIPSSVQNDFQGFEDEETMREVLGYASDDEKSQDTATMPPILLVSVKEMPVNAEVEVEVVAATRKAAISLGRTLHPTMAQNVPLVAIQEANCIWKWDTDHDHKEDVGISFETKDNDLMLSLSCHLSTLGQSCAGYAIVSAGVPESVQAIDIDCVLQNMFQVLEQSLQKANLEMEQVLHIRLYYLPMVCTNETVLSATIAAVTACYGKPAWSLVPVHFIHLLKSDTMNSGWNNEILLAMQVTVLEPTNLENELWIRTDQ